MKTNVIVIFIWPLSWLLHVFAQTESIIGCYFPIFAISFVASECILHMSGYIHMLCGNVCVVVANTLKRVRVVSDECNTFLVLWRIIPLFILKIPFLRRFLFYQIYVEKIKWGSVGGCIFLFLRVVGWRNLISCDSVEWTSRSRRLALRLSAITGGLGKAFLQLAVAWRRVVYLLTIDDTLGSALRVEGCDKGCSVSLGGFLFLRLKGCVTWNWANAIRISL